MSRTHYVISEGRRIPVEYDGVQAEVICDGCHTPVEGEPALVGTVLVHIAGRNDLVANFDAHPEHVTSAATACFNSLMHPVMP